MVYKSEDLWAAGSPEPPLRDQVVEFLEANPDQYFSAGEVSEAVFDLDPAEEAFEIIPEDKIELAMNERFWYTLKAELTLERLLEEGLVEKRSIRISDEIDALEAEEPDVFEDLDDDGPYDFQGNRSTYYRIVPAEV
jgi:hypothetical protein